jgi:hypothetical protein
MIDVRTRWRINYSSVFAQAKAVSFEEKVDCMSAEIAWDWTNSYKRNVKAQTAVCRFQYGGFVFIYDDTGELVQHGKAKIDDVAEGRVVAAFGISKVHPDKRNLSRTRGYLGPTSKVYAHFGNDYDKGHFIANATGGPLEINLFPQKRGINRGWSDMGKKYRQMEKFVANNPGTFVFSRPIYSDLTLRPVLLEFGYVSSDGTFISDHFENV